MADNSLAKAKSLGVLDDRSLSRRNALNNRDRVDFFKFTLNRSSNVKLQLSGLRSNADLSLLNESGKIVRRSKKGGTKAEQINRQLAAGTYYVQVQRRSSKGTKYKLTGSATSTTGGGNGGGSGGSGTLENPFDLGTLTSGTITRSRDTAGNIGSPTYYKFNLAQISDLNLTLSQVTGGGTMSLYYDFNRNGQLDRGTESTIKYGDGSESSNSPISAVLPATGTYFLEVYQSGPYTQLLYDLTANATPVPGNIPIDPGSEATTSYNLGTLSRGGKLEAKDYVGQIDETDIYRFNLTETSTVTFNKLDVAGDINVEVQVYQDKNNNGLIDATESLGYIIGETAVQSLQAGTYFLSVKQYNLSNSAYALTLTA